MSSGSGVQSSSCFLTYCAKCPPRPALGAVDQVAAPAALADAAGRARLEHHAVADLEMHRPIHRHHFAGALVAGAAAGLLAQEAPLVAAADGRHVDLHHHPVALGLRVRFLNEPGFARA